MSTEQMDWLDDHDPEWQAKLRKERNRRLPPANREPTETLFAQSVLAEFDRRDRSERLDAWERGLGQYSHRSDSSGYAGRMGLEVLAELRQTREQAEALAVAANRWHLIMQDNGWCDCEYFEGAGTNPCDLSSALRAFQEASHDAE